MYEYSAVSTKHLSLTSNELLPTADFYKQLFWAEAVCLKGLSHEMDLAFDDMFLPYGYFRPNRGWAIFYIFQLFQ